MLETLAEAGGSRRLRAWNWVRLWAVGPLFLISHFALRRAWILNPALAPRGPSRVPQLSRSRFRDCDLGSQRPPKLIGRFARQRPQHLPGRQRESIYSIQKGTVKTTQRQLPERSPKSCDDRKSNSVLHFVLSTTGQHPPPMRHCPRSVSELKSGKESLGPDSFG